MKVQLLVSSLAATLLAVTVSASPAWSYRWGGYNSFGSGYGYGNGLNALRYILPINSYRGNYNYNNGNGYGYNYNRGYNFNNACHHHHRRWW